jgi:hypothetical protein
MKTVTVCAVVGKNQWKFVRKIARDKNLSASRIVRHLIAQFQEDQSSLNQLCAPTRTRIEM